MEKQRKFMILEKRFIDEAIRIRTEYILCIKDILEKEDKVNKYKSEIENITSNLTIVCNKMKEDNNIDETILNHKLIEIEENIIKIQNEFRPINEKIEKLRNDAKFLNKIIKDKYPKSTDLEIHNALLPHLIEVDKKFKND